MSVSGSETTNVKRELDDLAQAKDQLNLTLARLQADNDRQAVEIGNLESALALMRDYATVQASLEDLRAKLESVNADLRQEAHREQEFSGRLNMLNEKRQTTATELSQRRLRIQRFAEVQRLARDRSVRAEEKRELEHRLEEVRTRLAAQRTERDRLAARQEELQVQLKLADASIDKERQSLARLRQLVLEIYGLVADSTDPECPLCGHDWGDAHKLKERINVRSDWASPALRAREAAVHRLKSAFQLLLDDREKLEGQISQSSALESAISQRLGEISSLEGHFRQTCEEMALAPDISIEQLGAVEAAAQREVADLVNESQSTEGALHELRAAASASRTKMLALQQQATELRVAIETTEQTLITLRASLSEKVPERMSRDPSQVAERLEGLRKLSSGILERRQQVTKKLADLQSSSSNLESRLASAERKKAEQAGAIEEIEKELAGLKLALSDAGLSLDVHADQVQRRIDRLHGQLRTIAELQEQANVANKLASWLATEMEVRRLEARMDELKQPLLNARDQARKHQTWSGHLTTLHSAILDIREKVENWQLRHYEPTINLLYQRLSAHPLFGLVRPLVDSRTQSLKIHVEVSPRLRSLLSLPTKDLAPMRYFSEAQLNAVALSIFLSNAFRQRWSRFLSVLLDDPVQNMDDFNANAFIDTRRAFVEQNRQFIVATCDLSLYRLMLVKLVCLNQNGMKRFSAYRLEGISAKGPLLVQDV